jgi:hypothetical protein
MTNQKNKITLTLLKKCSSILFRFSVVKFNPLDGTHVGIEERFA